MERKQLQDRWSAIRSGLLEIVDQFSPEELDYQPFPGGYTVREIILHIAQEEYGEVQYGITREIDSFPPPYQAADHPTRNSLKKLLETVHQQTLDYLEGLTDANLEDEVQAGWGGKYILNEMLWHVLEHEIHHRGELSLILGLLGKQGLDA